MKAVVIFLFIGALLLGGAYYFGVLSAGGRGIELIFNAPEKIFYGVPFDLAVGVGNNSADNLRDAVLSLGLPDGMVFADEKSAKSVSVKQLGVVGSGSLMSVQFKLVAVLPRSMDGGDGASGEPVAMPVGAVEARLSYAPGKSTTAFEKREAWIPKALLPGIEIALGIPEAVKSGEEFKITVDYANSADADMEGISLVLAYPEGFIFDRASADPESRDAEWDIGVIRRGSSDSIAIYGRMQDVEVGEFSAAFMRAGGGSPQEIAHASEAVAVHEPPMTVGIDVNDSPDYAAQLGETLLYTIGYSLDADVPVKKGLAIHAFPSSPLFDFSTIVVNDGGSFKPDSATLWPL